MRHSHTRIAPGTLGRQITVVALLASLITPVHAFGDEPKPVRAADVILHEQGTLQGLALNEVGQPVGSAKVRLLHNDQVVATTATDDAGQFTVRSLRNGTHVIHVDGSAQVVRFWGETAAPPTAVNTLTVTVQPDALVRGQAASTPGLLSNPWFIAGVVGITVGTIAIVENNNDNNNKVASP